MVVVCNQSAASMERPSLYTISLAQEAQNFLASSYSLRTSSASKNTLFLTKEILDHWS